MTTSSVAQIGIIGGSGLYDRRALRSRRASRHHAIRRPSGPYVVATLRGRRVVFLARHGHGHRLTPSELNYRANIFGFKTLGVEWILSASAVGSLREDYKPLDLAAHRSSSTARAAASAPSSVTASSRTSGLPIRFADR